MQSHAFFYWRASATRSISPRPNSAAGPQFWSRSAGHLTELQFMRSKQPWANSGPGYVRASLELASGGESMFENMLIEEKIKTRRGRATVLSFVLQAIAVAIVVLIPLMFTQALPVHMLETTLVAPPPPPPPPPPAAASAAPRHVAPQTTQVKNELEVPIKIPQKVAMVREQLPQSDQTEAAPSVGGVVGGVPGGVQGGTIGGVVGGVLNSVGTSMPKLAAPKRVTVSSGVTAGLLTHKVTPDYPSAAKAAHIQGTVVLRAIIGKDGKVQNLQVVSGHPMLAQAALEAVKQWRYKPYMLNGQPTEIDTNIKVDFKLAT